jgi:hypothetical protein
MDSTLLVIAGAGLLAYLLYKPPSPPPDPPAIMPITPVVPPLNVEFITYYKNLPNEICPSSYGMSFSRLKHVQGATINCITADQIPQGVPVCDPFNQVCDTS